MYNEIKIRSGDMKFDDVMSAAEAAERWGVSPVTIKQACAGQRNTPPRFTKDECRKSKGTWLVTRYGMERLYGKERKMLKVIDLNSYKPRVMCVVDSYKDAWDEIYENEMKQSPCICKNTKEQWDEWEDVEEIYPNFKWPENVDCVWSADWLATPIIDPVEYNEDSVRRLIDDLMLHYEIEEVEEDVSDDEEE